MNNGDYSLGEFKQMLSRTFDGKAEMSSVEIPSDDLEDDWDGDWSVAAQEVPEISDDLEDDFYDEDAAVEPIIAEESADVGSPIIAEGPAIAELGISSVASVERAITLQDEIKNTIYNLGFTEENCIAELNKLHNMNLATMEEVYEHILYNNYFKKVKVVDINTLTVEDLKGKPVEEKLVMPTEDIARAVAEENGVVEMPIYEEAPTYEGAPTYEEVKDEEVENEEVKNEEVKNEPVYEEPALSRVEQELNAMDHQPFIVEAVKDGRITDAIFEKYGDLYKSLYVADYKLAFGEELELDEDADVVYPILVGKYLQGMSDVDYKKIMYLTFRTDMHTLILEKGAVDSYADITSYKMSRVIGDEVELENFDQFYIAKKGVIDAYSTDILWYNCEEFKEVVGGMQHDVGDALIFYDGEYGRLPKFIASESSFTEFVLKPQAGEDYFYYNYNRFLDMLMASDLEISPEVCQYFSDMTDMDIAKYDLVFGNIVKYNKELLGCMTSKYYKVMLRCMLGLPGREPCAFASYRLLNYVCSAMLRGKYTLATTNMTTELGRDCMSISILGIPGVSMVSLDDFWAQFDNISTYLKGAEKVTLSVFNSVIRLRIED